VVFVEPAEPATSTGLRRGGSNGCPLNVVVIRSDSSSGASLDPRLLVVCDEAAITPLPKLPQRAATVSGAGILVTFSQSRAQLDTSCGRPADGVLTDHRSKLFYTSGLTDTATTDYLVLAGIEHVRADLTRGSRPENQPSNKPLPGTPVATICRSDTGVTCSVDSPAPFPRIAAPSGPATCSRSAGARKSTG
jgi:hypothetical protein